MPDIVNRIGLKNSRRDLQKLARAYGLLAGTCDAERVLAGTVSREWIASEVEHSIPLNALPHRLFRTQRGRDLLASELFEGKDIDPETLDPGNIDIQALATGRMINSNRIPKLEPVIHRAVLVANILLGVRLFGNHGRGCPSLRHDFIVAAMLQDALDKPYVFSTLSSSESELVDDDHLRSWFGERVTGHARLIQRSYNAFVEADGDSEVLAAEAHKENPNVANAVAAICASRLRLTSRAAGDSVISFVDDCRRHELRRCGIDVDADFPEKPFLQRDFELTRAAFACADVDHYALREPLRNTLLMAVEDCLADPAKRSRLSGRRGKAVHETHINLPMMEYFVAAEAPNSIETVHLASLEMMRALERGRRKSLSTMTSHAFRIAALAERVLGDTLEPLVVTLAMLHDVVEDGSRRVTGYDHSLRKILFRFGGPIAAMVSELTDAALHSEGAHKAQATFKHPHLLTPEKQYNVNRFTELTLRPSDSSQPYTLTGIVVKLLDTVVSLEEGIRDPELMKGWWQHSGARIFWAENMRGSIVSPLIERLLLELRKSVNEPEYARQPHSMTTARLRAGIALLETTLNYLDMYTTQNLAILASEYGLDTGQREFLLRTFGDANIETEQFLDSVVNGLLKESRLLGAISAGNVPGKEYVTLYPKGAGREEPSDPETFLAYRASALRRHEIRRELDAIREKLGMNSSGFSEGLSYRVEQVLAAFDKKMHIAE